MHFPVSWHPFFRDRMPLGEVYRHGTQHFDLPLDQLTLCAPGAQGSGSQLLRRLDRRT